MLLSLQQITYGTKHRFWIEAIFGDSGFGSPVFSLLANT